MLYPVLRPPSESATYKVECLLINHVCSTKQLTLRRKFSTSLLHYSRLFFFHPCGRVIHQKNNNHTGVSLIETHLSLKMLAQKQKTPAPPLGMHAVPVSHGLDGSVVQLLYPCRDEVSSTAWMDGIWDGLSPSKTVKVRLSRTSRWLDRYTRTFFTTSLKQ
jgi:hypothetical protein